MRAAFARLGWSPATFWSATPLELAAGLGLSSMAAGLTRGVFQALMQSHPDEGE
jgi:uncharacterized phage protein (TIGR02216 family)